MEPSGYHEHSAKNLERYNQSYKLNLVTKSNFCFKTADHKTAQLIQKMSEDLQVYCRNKPLLQSTPFIGKVNIKVQLYPWMKFYFPLFQLHSLSVPYPETLNKKI